MIAGGEGLVASALLLRTRIQVLVRHEGLLQQLGVGEAIEIQVLLHQKLVKLLLNDSGDDGGRNGRLFGVACLGTGARR